MKLHIVFCCFNNYDLLFGEQFEFLRNHRQKIVLIDDWSSDSEFRKASRLAETFELRLFRNRGKGIQMALQGFIEACCSPEDWILVQQQDVNFRDQNAVQRIEHRIREIAELGYNIGAFGFPNYIPNAHYHDTFDDLNDVCWRDVWLGVFCLTNSQLYRRETFKDGVYRVLSSIPGVERLERRIWHKVIFNRNFAPKTFPRFKTAVEQYHGFSTIDLPVWTAVVISSKAWGRVVRADSNFVFHLWFPDVAMQFMNNDYFVCLDTTQIVVNNWAAKWKYGQLGSVEEGSRSSLKMEPYGRHLGIWRRKWGFDYENPYPQWCSAAIRRSSLLDLTINRPTIGPLRQFQGLSL